MTGFGLRAGRGLAVELQLRTDIEFDLVKGARAPLPGLVECCGAGL